MERTESYRLMRGAREAYYEYIPELHTEFCFSHTSAFHSVYRDLIVGCDVAAHVTSAGVLSDTRRGRQCELFTKKGGNTIFRPFQSRLRRTFLRVSNEQCQAGQETIGCLQPDLFFDGLIGRMPAKVVLRTKL